MPRTRLELAPDELAGNGDDIGPVERDGAHVENACDGNVGTEGDQVDGNAPEDADPNGVERGPCESVDLGPDVGKWDQAVAGEGKHRSSQSLGGSKANELEDDEGGYREEDPGTLAQRIVEDLCHRLINGRREDFGGITHTEAQDNVEQPPKDIGKPHGERNGPWCFNLRFIDSVWQLAALPSEATDKRGQTYSSVM